MANIKKGLDYFSFNVDTFSDIKIRKLIKYQSAKAIPVYDYLRCIIYKEGYYIRWDNELPFTISEVLGYEEGYINEVIKCLFQVGLLSKKMFDSHHIITSFGIQKRYMIACETLRRKINIVEYSLLNDEEQYQNAEESPQNVAECGQNETFDTQNTDKKKGKEKKLNEIKKKGIYIPDFIEFKNFAIDNSKNLDISKCEQKYKAWAAAGWMDGNGKQITNWKSKILHSIQYWEKPDQINGQKITGREKLIQQVKEQLHGTN